MEIPKITLPKSVRSDCAKRTKEALMNKSALRLMSPKATAELLEILWPVVRQQINDEMDHIENIFLFILWSIFIRS